MNKVCLVFLTILIATSLTAQETLVGEGFHSGGYGGPVLKIGAINGKAGVFTGGRGGWIINHTFVIGGGAYNLHSDMKMDINTPAGKPLYLDLEYGGLELEYINDSDKLYHWTVHVTLGGGTVRLTELLMEHEPKEEYKSDGVYIFEPSINMDLNASSWLRIGIGATYRLALGLDLNEVSQSDISGPSGLIILKFGSF